MIKRKKLRLMRLGALVLLLLATAWGSAVPAVAYVLDGRHVIELMLDQMNLSNQLRVDQTLSLFDDRFEGGAIAVRQRVNYRIPARFRSEIKTDNLHRIYIDAGNKSLTLVDNKVVSQSRDVALQYKELFCYHSRKALVDQLSYLGMNVALSSYGRWQQKVVFVLGARNPNESSPQLWVDKESFLPVRWIFQTGKSPDGPNRIEFHYEDWHQVGGSRYPRVIKQFQDERLTRKIEIHHIETNPEISDNLFNIDYLKAGATKSGSVSGEPVPEDDVDQQIREFREIFQSD